MKLKIVSSTVVALALWVFAANLQAQLPTLDGLVQTVKIDIVIDQQTATNDNGTNITFVSKSQSYSTQNLLQILAEDENAEGNYAGTNFPAGAKLVENYGAFQVVDSTNNLLVDVSDILAFSEPSTNEVVSGRISDTKGLANPMTARAFIGRLDFDDTAIIGGRELRFYLQGTVKLTETDLENVRAGTITTILAGQLNNGAGDGTSKGNPFLITGSLKLGEKATYPIPIPGT